LTERRIRAGIGQLKEKEKRKKKKSGRRKFGEGSAKEDRSMRRHAVPSPELSSLPRFIMPCPHCGGQMLVTSVEPQPRDADVDDITHCCTDCGCAVTRTVGPPRRGDGAWLEKIFRAVQPVFSARVRAER
jgi:hypothetical protein